MHSVWTSSTSLVSVYMGEECPSCVPVPVQAETHVSTVHLSTGMALICYSETHENLHGKNNKCGLKEGDALRLSTAGADAAMQLNSTTEAGCKVIMCIIGGESCSVRCGLK